ncbi:MAG: cytochrome c biogenesis protein [Planctomycetota bacterium]|jgi:ABC-type transport system involved in cytochrome c biogenesis permease subunit
MSRITKLAPWLAAFLAILWMGRSSMPPKDYGTSFDVVAFAHLPVVYQGRVKPYDTLARNSLIIISDRQTWRDGDNTRRPAIEWLLDVMSGSPRAAEHRVFRIHNLDLLGRLGLVRRKGFRYAYSEFEPQLAEVELQAAQAGSVDPAERDVYDVQVLEFWQRLSLFRVLVETHRIPGSGPGPDAGPQAELNAALQRMERLSRFAQPHGIPPLKDGDEWQPMLRAAVEGAMTGSPSPVVGSLAASLTAWASGDVVAFNDNVAELTPLYPAALAPPGQLDAEVTFNHAAPFYRCAVLYVFAFLLGCFAWLGWAEPLRRTAFGLLVATFIVHTIAIGARVYISGYPPITNLYGTAIFIGWGCVLIGLILERIYPLGVGNTLSAMVGALTLLIAHFLAGDGDTLQMMQAVLDTKFWLATHVIIINFGYSATFLAAGLSIMYILRGVLTRSLDAAVDKSFYRMIYGVLCFGLLLSFIGTVLGGLWADDSWGRFWGWDPKENGALTLILHARWAGLVRQRGIAVLSVFGGVITAWSWFGVNQLGVGLHSYGFTESVTFWLLIFVVSQLAIIGLGLLPRSMWRSGQPQ